MKRLDATSPWLRLTTWTLTILCAAAWLTWLGVAAQAGATRGLAAYAGGEYAAAFNLLEPEAGKGDRIAQATLGRMLVEGRGVRRDLVAAAKWMICATRPGLEADHAALALRDRLLGVLSLDQRLQAQRQAASCVPTDEHESAWNQARRHYGPERDSLLLAALLAPGDAAVRGLFALGTALDLPMMIGVTGGLIGIGGDGVAALLALLAWALALRLLIGLGRWLPNSKTEARAAHHHQD